MKLLGALAIAVGLVAGWTQREQVIGAYRPVDATAEANASFDGLDVTIERAEATPSVYERQRRSADSQPPPALSFAPAAADRSIGLGPDPDPAMEGGTASLWGAVRTDDPSLVGLSADAVPPPERWPVAGAVVVIERITTGGTSTVIVEADETGVFELEGIHGGRYRIRAHVPSVATSGAGRVVFVAAGADARHEPVIERAPLGPVVALVDGDTTTVGSPWTIAATVATRHVDAEGRIVHRPVVGVDATISLAAPAPTPTTIDPESGEPIEPETPGVVGVLSAPVVATDIAGAARWLLSCDAAGPVMVTVSATIDGRTDRTVTRSDGCQPTAEPADGLEDQP
ncbi:MAG: carboxypeptidase-like regulatory domain-containing protein [Acidimicrobiales bacterium]